MDVYQATLPSFFPSEFSRRPGVACAARPFWGLAFDVSIAPTTAFAAGRDNAEVFFFLGNQFF